MKKIIAVVGDRAVERGSKKFLAAYGMGKLLAENGYRVQSGGLGGIMEAAFEGAHDAENYVDGTTIALVPSFDPGQANKYADIAIPTGLDVMRNAMVANADAVVVVGGGAGTLSEVAFAWAFGRLIIAFDNVDGWSAKLAGQRLDNTVRCEGEDKIYGVSSPEEAIEVLQKNLDRYTARHDRIKI